MAGGRQYFVKHNSGRVLGPIALERVRELIFAGQLQGQEPAALKAEGPWKKLSSFPEVAEIFLEQLSKEANLKQKKSKAPAQDSTPPETSAAADPPAAAEPFEPNINPPVSEGTAAAPATRTYLAPKEEEPSFRSPEVAQKPKKPRDEDAANPYGEVPTLINIKRPTDPDLERTKVNQVSPAHREGFSEYVADATKLIPAQQKMPLAPEKGDAVPVAKSLGIVPEKPRIISRKVVYIIIACLLLTLMMMQAEERPKEAVRELRPATFRFKPVQINIPTQPKDKKPDVGRSIAFLNEAMKHFRIDTPTGYIRAANLLYKSYFFNQENIVARSLLVSTYIRLTEIVPRNERFYNTVSELIKTNPGRKTYPAEFFVAQSEFELMMERPERALQTIEAVAKRSPSPEVLYQLAASLRALGERNRAIATVTRALKMDGGGARSPRLLFLYAQLLEEKEQRGAALRVLRTLLQVSPGHGAALLLYARILYRNNDVNRSMLTLVRLIQNPHRADPNTLAQAFLLAARIYESKRSHSQALRFARAAKLLMPASGEADELIFRIRSNNPDLRKLYERLLAAKEKEKSKEYTEAVNLYIRARETNPSSPVPLFHLAQLYESIGKPHMAVELYRKITQMEQKSIDAFYNLANLYLRQYEIDQALALMRTIRSEPTQRRSPRITHMAGRIALFRSDPQQARANFVAAIEQGARIPQLYVDMANLEEENKNVALAEFYYSAALRYDPFNEDALLGIAMSRFFKNTPSDAIRFLEAKLFSRPNSPQILTNLALIHLRSGNREVGKQYLQRAVRSDPNYSRAYRLMGNLVKEEGDRQSDFEEKRRSYKFALASYAAYSKLAPFEPDGYMSAAELYFYVRDLGAAAKNYNKVLSLAPNYPRARLQLAKIARNGQDPDAALTLVNEEIKRHMNSSDAYVELGKIRLAKKEYALASQALTTAAKLNPKSVDAIIHLGYVHYLQGDFQSAIALFERALEIDPLKEDIHWKIGLAFEKDGKRTKAISAFKNFQGLTTDPEKLQKVREKILKLQ